MRFRLARVLRLRAQLRQQAQEEVLGTVAVLARLEEDAEAARAAQDDVRATEDAAMPAGVSGAELASWRAYEAAQAARELAIEDEQLRASAELARQRETLLERRREERKLEHLRERAAERALELEGRATTVLLDELALRGRSKGEGG